MIKDLLSKGAMYYNNKLKLFVNILKEENN